ncbi:hypothetical protein Goarm_000081 [Gossypium armourianum]|uniref:Uncharacterized protein n=2 Tax=Gossypium TaxID=3633 RepID=A0A7J9K8X0_9ROSI|nr:hypothetical protein [Gossypium klotzschianum]MBA0842841.1 hypothetical protein [Gossypium armourianum]
MFGLYLLYYFRVFERQIGSNKYSDLRGNAQAVPIQLLYYRAALYRIRMELGPASYQYW